MRASSISYGSFQSYAQSADAVRAALLDLHLLATADALVFTFSSNFGQMALHLMIARRGLCLPLVPLDNTHHAVGRSIVLERSDLGLPMVQVRDFDLRAKKQFTSFLNLQC